MIGRLRPSEWPAARQERLLGLASLAFALVVVTATALHAMQLRDAIRNAADNRLANLARILTKEVNRTLVQTRRLTEELNEALVIDMARPNGIDALLDALPRQQTLLREIAIIDGDGRVIASSDRRNVGLDISDRTFAARPEPPRDGRITIGLPAPGRGLRSSAAASGSAAAIDGHITLVREADTDPRGRRIVAVIGTHSLVGDLRFLASAEDVEISLHRYDGQLLATTDRRTADRSGPHPIFETFLPDRESGAFTERSPDGRTWLAHFDTTADFPVVVEVRMSDAAIAQRLESELVAPALVLAVTLVAIALYTRMTASALRRRARSEQLAATQERRLRNIVDTAADGIVTLDGRDVVREYNRAAEAIFGLPAREVIGRPVAELLPRARIDARALRRLRDAAAAGPPDDSAAAGPTLLRAARPDGAPMELSLALSEVVDQGETLLTGIVRDVTELRRQEQALRDARDAAQAAADAKAQFLAVMSHELRTPMTGILGMIDLLDESALDAEQRHFVGVLRGSARALLAVLNDALDFSKVEAGRLDLERIDFQPLDIAREVVQLCSHAASRRGVVLSLRCLTPTGGLPAVCGDPTRLRQVLSNLVGNAIKFTENGRVEVTADARTLEDGRIALSFEVADTGVGIDPAVLPTLFQPFQQADSSTTRRFGGTGLGLAICRRLVEAMDGQIGVDSEPGKGSTFCFTVRLAAASGQAPSTAVSPPVARTAPRGLRVLVAEDNPTNRLLVSTWLRRASHHVDLVEDGAKAVIAARDNDYDIVLMDMQMPELDGASATRAIRALEGPRSRVPIVALTADALPEGRARYLASGLDAFLTKPIDWGELERVLARCTDAPGAAAAPLREPAVPSGTDTPRAATAGGDGARGAAADAGEPPPEGDPRPDATGVAEMQSDLGVDVWTTVARIYWPKAEADLDACRSALARGDEAALRRVAHSLKGASSSLGFASVARCAASLELGPADLAPAALKALEASCAAVHDAWAERSEAPQG